MQRQLSCFIAFTGVFLAQLALARGECDLQKVNDCVNSASRPGFLQSFQNANETALDSACGVMKTTLRCIEEGRQTCEAVLLEQLQLSISAIQQIDTMFCNEAFRCLTQMQDCIRTEPDIVTLLSNSQVALSGSANCPEAANVVGCFEERVSKKCLTQLSVRNTINGLQMMHQYCRETNCTSLMECQGMYLSQNPKDIGLDYRTCLLMVNHTGCISGALASCPDLQAPVTEPPLPQVAELIEELCQLMGQSEVSAIYRCTAFTRCVNTKLTTINPFSVNNQCLKLQGIIGCAVNSVQKCRAVTSSSALTFIDQANQLALKASARGCGVAEIHTASCAEFLACKAIMATLSPDSPYSQRCQATRGFQECTHNAMIACNLTAPVDDDGDDSKPSLLGTAAITGKMCTALEGRAVTTCQLYTECMTNANLPLSDAGLMDTGTWCELTAHSLLCVHFHEDKCPIPASLSATTHSLHQELLDHGCHIITSPSTTTSRPSMTSQTTTTSQKTSTSQAITTSRHTSSERPTSTDRPTKTESIVSTDRTPAELKRTTTSTSLPVDNVETPDNSITPDNIRPPDHSETPDNTPKPNNTDAIISDDSMPSDDVAKPNNTENVMSDNTMPSNNNGLSDNMTKPDDSDNTDNKGNSNMSDGIQTPDNTDGESDSVTSEDTETSDSGSDPSRESNLKYVLPVALTTFLTRHLI